MSGTTLVAVPDAGEMTLWRLVEAGQPEPSRSNLRRSAAILCFGLVLTGAAAVVTWLVQRPDIVVQSRIVADGPAGRAALSDMALRLAGVPGEPVSLQEGGQALVVTVRGRDPVQAERRSRSLVDAILDAPVPTPPMPVRADMGSPDARPGTERDRIAAAIIAADAQRAAVSASLTTLARDIASASHAADGKPGHETLDKGNAALADLQLQRLQLASKYQDTYPAVIALDGQIRNLHVFLADEAQRVQGHPAQAEAANAVLNGERDRLRGELTQLDARRRDLAAQLDVANRRLAAMPASVRAPVPAALVAPMLVVATTSNLSSPDHRLTMGSIVAAIGMVLSGLAALVAGRRRTPNRAGGLLLEPVPVGMLPVGTVRPLPPPGFPSLLDNGPVRAPVGWVR